MEIFYTQTFFNYEVSYYRLSCVDIVKEGNRLYLKKKTKSSSKELLYPWYKDGGTDTWRFKGTIYIA